MKCFDPTLCYTTDSGKKLYRSFSMASEVFKRVHQQVFNCGKCLVCRRKKAYELASRCVLHSSLYKQNCFITLTYDEDQEGYHNNFEYKDIQDFKKRLRSHVLRKHGKRIQIFNVHEYGRNRKKHWHLICFNHDFADKVIHSTKDGITLYKSEVLRSLWPFGFNTIGDVELGSAMYQAKYMEKDYEYRNTGTIYKAHSRHSGIGKEYFLKHYDQILRLGYVPVNGRKLPVPRYFERLAHKHFSHFFEPINFEDTKDRKALYRPFRPGEANFFIADLFAKYKLVKDDKIKELEKEWEAVMLQHFQTGEDPEFVTSGSNALYDLLNKVSHDPF